MKVKAAIATKAGAPLSIETVDLDGPRAGEVLVDVDGTEMQVPMDAIGNAKLVLTDSLIAATGSRKACNENKCADTGANRRDKN